MKFINQYLQAISKLCLQHKVKRLYVFGSVLTSRFSQHSDVDFIVDFEPVELTEYAKNYFALKFGLENTIDRKVDLLEEQAISNPYFKSVVENQRQLIYGY
jgi:predicted nucleotidyltransferase